MNFDYRLLKAKIVEKFGNQKSFARALNTNPQRVSMVLNCKAYLTSNEILLWCDALDIDTFSIPAYFFAL